MMVQMLGFSIDISSDSQLSFTTVKVMSASDLPLPLPVLVIHLFSSVDTKYVGEDSYLIIRVNE